MILSQQGCKIDGRNKIYFQMILVSINFQCISLILLLNCQVFLKNKEQKLFEILRNIKSLLEASPNKSEIAKGDKIDN